MDPSIQTVPKFPKGAPKKNIIANITFFVSLVYSYHGIYGLSTKIFTKNNCNLRMQERLTILKMLIDKRVIVMNKYLDIYWACRHKMTFYRYFVCTVDLVLTGERVRPLKGFSHLMTWNHQRSFLNSGNGFQGLSAMKQLKLNRTLC